MRAVSGCVLRGQLKSTCNPKKSEVLSKRADEAAVLLQGTNKDVLAVGRSKG